MRIAILNWTNRHVGGSSRYLTQVLPRLARRGHELAFAYETDAPGDREPIPLPPGTPTWRLDAGGAYAELRAWAPQVVYAHGFQDQDLESRVRELGPTVFLAHDYYGTCISGGKATTRPRPRPCDQVFGPGCLVRYLPQRCGGRSPVTMLREYRRQSRRLEALRGYDAVLTLSSHMAREYARHEIAARPVLTVPIEEGSVPPASRMEARADAPVRVLYAGRFEPLKGGAVLLDALPGIADRLDRSVEVTFVGEGTARRDWMVEAERLERADPRLRVRFTGWLEGAPLTAAFEAADLLVVPSLWPEPFGLVGLEAARSGLPVAAFAVGGISEWLRPGVDGYLAPGDPPTATGLADAVVRCLRNPRLATGVGRVSPEAVFEAHVDTVVQVFQEVSRAAEHV